MAQQDQKNVQLEEAAARKELDAAVERNLQKLDSLTSAPSTEPPPLTAPQHYDAMTPEQQAAVRAQTAAGIQRVEQINEDSWQKTYERGTIWGTAKNLGAHVLNTITNVPASLVEMGLDFVANTKGMTVSDEDAALFYRKKAHQKAVDEGTLESDLEALSMARIELDAQLSRGDIDQERYDTLLGRINNKRLALTPLTDEEQARLDVGDGHIYGSTTVEDKLEDQAALREWSASVDNFQRDWFDHTYQGDIQKLAEQGEAEWNSEINTTRRELGVQQIQQGNYIEGAGNVVEGTWDGLSGYAENVWDNPEVALDIGGEALSEVVPFLLGSGAGKASNAIISLGDANDAADAGIQAFVEREGRQPTTEEKAMILVGQAAYAGLDYLSTERIAKSLGLPKKKATPEVKAPSKEQVKDTLLKRTTDGAKKTAQRTKDIAKLTAKETATGLTQGVLEQTALTANADPEDINTGEIVTSAVVEGIGGATAASPKPVIGQALDTTKGVLKESGIAMKALANKSSDNLANDFSKRSVEEQEQLRQKSDEAVSTGDLSTVTDEKDDKFDSYVALDTIARRLQSEDISDTEKETLVEQAYHVAEALDAQVDVLKQQEETLVKEGVSVDDTRIKNLIKEREVAQKKSSEALSYAVQIVASTPIMDQEEVQATIEEATQADQPSEDLSLKVDRVITSAMLTPKLLDRDQAITLSESAGITSAQKNYLASFAATEDTMEEVQTLDGVSKDIYYGNTRTGMRGLEQYRVMVASALSAGKTDAVARIMTDLRNFTEGKSERANDFTHVLTLAQNGADAPQLVLAHSQLNEKYQRKGRNKKYSISDNYQSRKLVQAMQGEAKAIQAVYDELNALGAVAAESGKVDQEAIAPWLDLPEVETGTTETADNQQTTTETVAPVDASQQTVDEYFNAPDVAATTETAPLEDVPPLGEVATDTSEETVQEAVQEEAVTESITTEDGYVINPDTGEILEMPEAPPAATGEPPTAVAIENAPSTEQLNKTTDAQVTLETTPLASRLVDSIQDVARRARVSASKFDAPRLLQNVNNVFTQMIQGTNFVNDFVSDGALTRKQKDRTLPHLSQYVTEEVVPSFDKIFDASQSEIYQMLVNEDGTVDENVKGAFGVAIFNWVTVFAHRTLTNKDEDINSLIGRPKETAVGTELRNLLIHKGSKPDTVAEVLGRDITQVLGIKFNNQSFDNEQRNAEMALGHLALNIMADTQVVTIDNVTGAQLDVAAPQQNKRNPHERHFFVRARSAYTDELAANGGLTKKTPLYLQARLGEKVAGMVNSVSETEDVLSKLFGFESQHRTPSLEPITEVTETLRRTPLMQVPERMKQALAKAQSVEWGIKLDVDHTFTFLSKAGKDRLAGIRSVDKHTHVDNVASIEGRNEAIRLAIKHYEQFKAALVENGGIDASFFFKYFASKQSRSFMDSNTVTPQGDKNHRHLVKAKSWVATISTDENDPKHMLFRMALGQAFGVKIDGQPAAKSMAEIDALLQDPDVLKAVDAIRNIRKETKPNDGGRFNLEADLFAGLDKVGGNMHALDGLHALTAYLDAKESGTAAFTTDIAIEVDGKTNGPAIALMQLGAFGDLSELEKFGVFTDATSDYTQWYAQDGNNDAYETLANVITEYEGVVMEYLNNPGPNANGQQPTPGQRKFFQAMAHQMPRVAHYLGDIGRSIAKDPTMQTIYGSGKQAISNNLSGVLIENFRTEMEAIQTREYDGLDGIAVHQARGQDAQYLVYQINALLHNNAKHFPEIRNKFDVVTRTYYPDYTTLLGYSFDNQKEEAIRNVMWHTYGAVFNRAIESLYGGFFKPRNEFNAMMTFTNRIYVAEYNRLVEARIGELTNPNHKHYRADFNPDLHDLPRADLQRIERMLLPLAPTVTNVLADNEGPAVSIFVGANELQKGEGDAYANYADLSMPNAVNAQNKKVKYVPKTYTARTRILLNEIGVGPAVLSTQMFDNGNAVASLEAFDTLSVFDGHFYGLKSVQEGVQTLNQAFFEQNRDFSYVEDAQQKYTKALERFAEMQRSGDLSESDIKLLTEMSLAIGESIEQVGSKREQLFDAVTNVHQYVFPGESYPTKDKPAENVVEAEVESIVEEAKEEVYPESQWGELGQNFDLVNYPRYKALEKFLEANPITDAQTVLERMATGLSAKNRTQHNQLLGALATQLSKIKTQVPVEIHYVQPDTQIENELDAEYLRGDGRNALACCQTRPGEPVRIYIKSADFVGHGTNQSTILHEIVHAYTVAAIYADNPPKQVREAKAELEKLRQRLIREMDTRGEITWETQDVTQPDGSVKKERVPHHVHYANALQDIGELVAWGMTDSGFQNELRKVPVAGKMKYAYQTFMNTVRNLLGITTEHNTAFESVMDLSMVLVHQQQNPDFDSRNMQFNPSFNQEQPKRLINSRTVFKGLRGLSARTVSEAEETRLEDILAKIEQDIPLFESYVEQANETVSDVVDQYYDSLVNGRNVFTSRLRQSGMPLTTQELYVAEQIEVSTRVALQMDPDLRKEVQRMLAAAKQQLPLSAFADPGVDIDDPANKDARNRAAERRNSIFRAETVSSETKASETSADHKTTANRSDYLARFVALGMVHKPFRDALLDVDLRTPALPAGTSIGTRIQQLFNKVFEFLGAQILRHRKSMVAQTRLDSMFIDLAGIRIRQQSKLIQKSEEASRNIERTLGGLSQSIRSAVNTVAGSAVIKDSSQAMVRSLGMATQMATGRNPEQIIQTIDAVAKPFQLGKQGIIGELWTELKGQNEGNVMFYEQLRKSKHRIDQARQHVEQAMRGSVEKAFSRELSEKERIDLTKVVVKLDLSSLLDTYNLNQIDQFLRDPEALKKEIRKLRKRLDKFPEAFNYRQDANDLGFYLAKEVSTSEMLLLNARNIARQAGRNTTVKNADALAAEPIIDRLATLYGISHTDMHHRETVSELIREENHAKEDTGDNGVMFVMNMHRALSQRAKDDLFMGAESMMIKGYTRDVTNPHASLKVVQDLSDTDLEARGYTVVNSLPADGTDTIQGERYLVMSDSDKMVSRVTGALSFTSRKRKGSTADVHTKADVKQITEAKHKIFANMAPIERDPSKQRGAKMVPVFNDKGDIAGYRYLMSAENRDRYLERNNDIGEVLANLGSSILDKTETKAVNDEIIEALALDFRDNQSSPGEYVIVGENSTDKELGEIWRVLPKETKDAVRRHFGGKDIYVRRDMVRIMFGFKQPALVNLWDMSGEDRNMIQNMIVTMFEHLPYFSKHTIARMRKTGEIWDEMVKEVKDILVIKTGMTLLGNFISNLSVLYIAGVPLTKMAQLHKEGYNGIVSYQRDTKELAITQSLLAGNPSMTATKRAVLEDRIAQLEDDIAANPVRELVEAGAMSTIVEDIDDQVDPFSYKSKLTQALDARTQWVPDIVKTAAGVVTMSRDTSLYKVLNHSTQVSDFVARYAMYKQLTGRKRDPMSKRDALNEIMETFVMYDVPTNKYVEYLNRKAFLLFTKYYFRIQAVIVKRMRRDPGRMAALAIANHYFDFWNILESSFLSQDPLSRFANPAELVMTSPSELLTLRLLD